MQRTEKVDIQGVVGGWENMGREGGRRGGDAEALGEAMYLFQCKSEAGSLDTFANHVLLVTACDAHRGRIPWPFPDDIPVPPSPALLALSSLPPPSWDSRVSRNRGLQVLEGPVPSLYPLSVFTPWRSRRALPPPPSPPPAFQCRSR